MKDIKLVRPTIHRYISGRVKTDFRRIDADEFTVATLLPVQRFAKASIPKFTQTVERCYNEFWRKIEGTAYAVLNELFKYISW